MSKKKNRPERGESTAYQWNPPKRRAGEADESFYAAKNVSSATDCTGLAARVPGTQAGAEALSGLYAVHEIKPQGNPGKDNPHNPGWEKGFHRAEEKR